MFLWTSNLDMKTFGTTPEEAKISKPLAANQGLYNGFLAIGLILGLVHPVVKFGMQIQAFFLLCIIIAAIYAGLMVKFSIVIIQGLPALIALIFLLIRW